MLSLGKIQKMHRVRFVELVAAGLLEFYSLPNTAALQKCDMVHSHGTGFPIASPFFCWISSPVVLNGDIKSEIHCLYCMDKVVLHLTQAVKKCDQQW